MKYHGILLAALLVTGATGWAQETVTVELTGVNGVNDGQYYVLPYDLTIDNAAANIQAICFDALHDVSIGQTWQAYDLTLSQAASEGVFSGPGALQGYETVAYLASWFFTDSVNMTPQNQVDLQHAIWDVFDPNGFPLPAPGTDAFLDTVLTGESTGIANLEPSDYSILSAIPDANGNQVQSFIIYTPVGQGHALSLSPEPGTLFPLFTGVLLIAVAKIKRRTLRNNPTR